MLSYFVLTFYDRLGTIYAGHKVSYGRVAFASFCAYALSHNLGFAAVSGAAVRYRLYSHWGLTPVQIAKTVAFCSLTFGLGGMVLGGTILFIEPRAVPFFGTHLPRAAMYGFGALLWAIVLGYVTFARVLRRVRLFGQIHRAARRAHGGAAGAARHRGRGDHRDDLLPVAADGAAPDLGDLPRRLRRVVHRRPADQPAGRHRRVRHRDAARPGPLCRRPRASSARSWCSGSTTT